MNVKSQRTTNVKLVFKRDASLSSALIHYIKKHYRNSLIVNDYQEVYRHYQPTTYWINLHVTDGLLPHAIVQWEQIIKRHPGKIVQIRYLKNEWSLVQQTGHLIKRIQQRHPVQVDTVKRMMELPVNKPLFQLSLAQQLWILLGLQNYRVIDTPKRYALMNDFHFGNNVLYRSSPRLIKDYQQHGLSALIKIVLSEPELVQVSLPTVILTRLNFNERLQWLKQMIESQHLIGDARLAKRYQQTLQRSITDIQRSIFQSNLNRFQKSRRLAMVNRLAQI